MKNLRSPNFSRWLGVMLMLIMLFSLFAASPPPAAAQEGDPVTPVETLPEPATERPAASPEPTDPTGKVSNPGADSPNLPLNTLSLSNSPIPISPNATIPYFAPTFKWEAGDGERYQLEVWNQDPTPAKKVYSKSLQATKVCGRDELCSFVYPKQLKEGNYYWQVRVKKGKVVSAWESLPFSVAFTGFNSSFSSDYEGWRLRYPTLTNPSRLGYPNWWLWGDSLWTWYGANKTWASASYDAYYRGGLDYTVTMRRWGGVYDRGYERYGGYANGISIRADPKLVGRSRGWKSEYRFVYARNPRAELAWYSVWRVKNNKSTALQPWTYSSYINNGDGDPNELRVIADSGEMEFIINDILVWSGYDPVLTTGMVGVKSDVGDWNGDYFAVDDVILVHGVSAGALSERRVSPEQQALNAAALGSAGNQVPEYYSPSGALPPPRSAEMKPAALDELSRRKLESCRTRGPEFCPPGVFDQ
ncbi:MAG: hypothetical protein U1B80_06985 [Anaerolineaceae bacterium]|nr:hypothetical protein [Anaerolineaceae bacterium]